MLGSQNKEQISAQEFTNVSDIKSNILYSRNGYIFKYLRIMPVSTDLMSKNERNILTEQLTGELSLEKEPFHFISVGRPVDVQPYLEYYSQLKDETSNDVRRTLLQEASNTMTEFAFGNEVSENYFYFYLYKRLEEDAEKELTKWMYSFTEHFENVGIKTSILNNDEIIMLCNLINNPNTILMESIDYHKAIPLLMEEG